VIEVPVSNIGLALICRKGEIVDPNNWSTTNKAYIAAEHVWNVSKFFEEIKIPSHSYHLDRIVGSSEGYLVNTDKYLLCDAIVETGKSIESNNLDVWKYIIPKG